MNRLRPRFLAPLVALTVVATTALAEPPPLRHNPFSRPPAPTVDDMPAGSANVAAGAIELRATLVGDAGRLANVGGRIMRPGDVFHGLELLQVYEDRAVFKRGAEQYTVYVKPNREPIDDEH